MPTKRTIEKARQDKREGKSPSTQAGEFVRAEIDKIRRGEHGARSPQQAIAIGLSEARRAGVDLPPTQAAAAPPATRIARGEGRPEARTATQRLANSPLAPSAQSRLAPLAEQPVRCSPQSRTHQRRQDTLGERPQSSPHAGASAQLTAAHAAFDAMFWRNHS